jgi:hypothetical protein
LPYLIVKKSLCVYVGAKRFGEASIECKELLKRHEMPLHVLQHLIHEYFLIKSVEVGSEPGLQGVDHCIFVFYVQLDLVT